MAPLRTQLAAGYEISQIITGLWQVADLEKEGKQLDQDQAAKTLVDYATEGFDTFDMADHYGSAELIAGCARKILQTNPCGQSSPIQAKFHTKWCPKPGLMTSQIVYDGIRESADRLGVETIDLLQFHWWSFEHPGYLEAMEGLALAQQEGRIAHLGLTNFDTDHLHLLIKEGFNILTNQVVVSLLDRRALEEMGSFCLEHNVKLLAYGVVAGGFLSERWVGKPEPSVAEITDWSKMKYKGFIKETGGWATFQNILEVLDTIARRSNVSITNVATRWVLDQPAVAGAIIGARLNATDHRRDNLAVFSFSLSEEDRVLIDEALSKTRRIAGDCGREYRRPPFLTASGDLSHHLASIPKLYNATSIFERPKRMRINSESYWESACGYSRAVRVGNRILVSGTTATHGLDRVICAGDPRGQAVYILDKIIAGITALGGSLADVVRTRVYLKNTAHCEEVSRVHGRYFEGLCPANTTLEVSGLIGNHLVEIEAEAVIDH